MSTLPFRFATGTIVGETDFAVSIRRTVGINAARAACPRVGTRGDGKRYQDADSWCQGIAVLRSGGDGMARSSEVFVSQRAQLDGALDNLSSSFLVNSDYVQCTHRRGPVIQSGNLSADG